MRGGCLSQPRYSGLCLSLSPRARGIHAVWGLAEDCPGSIPACAGEPNSGSPIYLPISVYPRVCGGTGAPIRYGRCSAGLSPRVRGNLDWIESLACEEGSIPACAGEPPCARRGRSGRRVYPRVCGGTLLWLLPWLPEWGLSPRVRGNHGRLVCGVDPVGSIPACAGEPSPVSTSAARPGVYPRVCGGTRVLSMRNHGALGLSPRVRGNHGLVQLPLHRPGSIPACAGEPRYASSLSPWNRVYPRVCGGTLSRRSGIWATRGLSPRVRGNQVVLVGMPPVPGSIPACAGEPPSRGTPRPEPEVYPRVCGGTR